MSLAKELMGAGFSGGQAKAVGGLYTTFVAAGSVQGDATPITASLCVVTGADGTKGVILPAAEVGDEIKIINNSGSTLKVYPPSGAAILVAGSGLGSANAAYSQTTYTACEFTCYTSAQWGVNKGA